MHTAKLCSNNRSRSNAKVSHEQFTNATGSSPPAEQDRVIVTNKETDEEKKRRWFQDAQENDWTFVYLPRGGAGTQTPRKLLIVAEGIEPATLLRILVDESEIDP
jgi:hypothetical protein